MTNSPGRLAGHIIGLVFGGLWALLGAGALAPDWRLPAQVAAVVITALLVLRRMRRGGGPRTGMFQPGTYFVAVGAEVAAIMAASALLPRYGLQGYMAPVVGVIVGLHFIGLWRASGMRVFLWIAAAMCAVSLAAVLLPPVTRDIATGFGNALVLWVGASLG